ncbi:P-loop containing nucleoside triphosphate hydrolase protein [Raphanus sativus]|nr:P-loop containing nucleoside triphosphate hydrolase protein [Raphanus sativus]
MPFSSLISPFPLCSISSSDHRYVVSTHPQSNTKSQSITESVTKLQHYSTCSKSCFSGAFLLQTGISVLFRFVIAGIKVEKSNNGVSTKGGATKGAVGALLVYDISRQQPVQSIGRWLRELQSDVVEMPSFCSCHCRGFEGKCIASDNKWNGSTKSYWLCLGIFCRSSPKQKALVRNEGSLENLRPNHL